MKKLLSMLATALTLASSLHSQTDSPYTVNVITDVVLPKGFKMVDALYHDNQVISVGLMEDRTFYFKQFSNDMRPVKENEAALPSGTSDRLRFKETITINDKVYFLFWEKDKEAAKEHFYALEFFPTTLTTGTALKVVAETGILDYGLLNGDEKYTLLNRPKYYYTRTSADNSKFLFAVKSTGMVFDKNMNLLWSTDLPSNSIRTLDVANNGDVITTLHDTGPYTLQVYSKDKTPLSVNLPEVNMFFLDCFFVQNTANDMYIAGQYSGTKSSYTKGIYLLPVNNAYQPGTILQAEHPTSFINDSLAGAQKVRKNVNTKAYCMEDGSIKIISEVSGDNTISNGRAGATEFNSRTGGMESSQGASTAQDHIIYYSGDMVITSISKEKKVEWTKTLTKYNKGNTKNELSYFCIPVKNDLHLFFNDQVAKYIAGVKTDPEGLIIKTGLSQETFKGGVQTEKFTSDGKAHVLTYKGKSILCISLK